MKESDQKSHEDDIIYQEIEQTTEADSNVTSDILMKKYLSQKPEHKANLKKLVTEFGLSVDVAIYALLSQ